MPTPLGSEPVARLGRLYGLHNGSRFQRVEVFDHGVRFTYDIRIRVGFDGSVMPKDLARAEALRRHQERYSKSSS